MFFTIVLHEIKNPAHQILKIRHMKRKISVIEVKFKEHIKFILQAIIGM
jgi:hypothetical protein